MWSTWSSSLVTGDSKGLTMLLFNWLEAAHCSSDMTQCPRKWAEGADVSWPKQCSNTVKSVALFQVSFGNLRSHTLKEVTSYLIVLLLTGVFTAHSWLFIAAYYVQQWRQRLLWSHASSYYHQTASFVRDRKHILCIYGGWLVWCKSFLAFVFLYCSRSLFAPLAISLP